MALQSSSNEIVFNQVINDIPSESILPTYTLTTVLNNDLDAEMFWTAIETPIAGDEMV